MRRIDGDKLKDEIESCIKSLRGLYITYSLARDQEVCEADITGLNRVLLMIESGQFDLPDTHSNLDKLKEVCLTAHKTIPSHYFDSPNGVGRYIADKISSGEFDAS